MLAALFPALCPQALVIDEKKFQYILRILNTNVNGKDKVMYALTKIKGIGRRFANLVCKKADIDMNKRYARGWCECLSAPSLWYSFHPGPPSARWSIAFATRCLCLLACLSGAP